MGLIDAGLVFSENLPITGASTFSNSVNVTNNNTNASQRAFRDIAPGEPVRFIVIVTETFNTLTTLEFKLFNDVVDVFSGIETLAYSQVVALADLTVGKKVVDVPIPNNILPDPPLTDLFYQIQYLVVGANPTLGKLSSHFGWGSYAASHDVT